MIQSDEKRRSDEGTNSPFVAPSLRRFVALVAVCAVTLITHAVALARNLDFYFIDTEGGASTLIVTPAGESVLIDTGNPGERDPGRIVDATRIAGIKEINTLVVTHYHVDHMGGAPTLGEWMPIHTIYDNADQNVSRDKASPEYLATKCDRRIMINPGDTIPLKQAEGAPNLSIVCLGCRKKFIEPPPGAKENPFASESKGKPLDLTDNANSIVLLLSFGDFRFYDGGDLTWNMEHDLATPVNRAGTVDVYQVTHHGLDLSNNPILVKALEPTVAIMNNGTTKGCGPETFATLKSTPSIQAIFQLHKNLREDGNVNNTTEDHIANIEKDCKGNFVKMSVNPDGGSYTVSIPSNGFSQTFQTRKHE
jgi:beta-lactamase superfamily II metal-dependent hydrolase